VRRSPGSAAKKQSTVPSPPSATGIAVTWQSGKNAGMVCEAMAQISALEREPLNESEITMQLFIGRPPKKS
jgi:hypothetical protein